MGWPFSPSYRVTTASTASRLLTDNLVSDPWPDMVLKSAIYNAPIRDVLLNELLLGLNARMNRARTLITDPTKFGYGYLEQTLLIEAQGLEETRAHLDAQPTGPVAIDYHHFGLLNLGHAAFEYITNTYGYDHFGNVLTAESTRLGFPVYLEHLQYVLNTDQAEPIELIPVSELPLWEYAANTRFVPWTNPFANLESWEYVTTGATRIVIECAYLSDQPRAGTATAADWAANGVPETAVPPDTADPLFAETGFNFTLAFGQTTADIEDFIHRYTLTVPLSTLGYDEDQTYFQTKYYHTLSGETQTAYFTHSADAGTIATIENTAKDSTKVGNFLPFVSFRENFTNLAVPANETTTRYEQDKRLMKALGMDYQTIADAIYDSPELVDISQSFLMFGVPLNATNPQSVRYLYEFFYWLNINKNTPATGNVFDNVSWFSGNQNARSAIVFYQGTLKQTIDYAGTSTAFVAGNIANDSSAKVNECISYSEQRTQTIPGMVINGFTPTQVDQTRQITVWVFKKQLTATHYRVIEIADVNISYYLYGKGGVNDRPRNAAVTEEAALLIPVSDDLMREHFTPLNRTILLKHALHIVTNAYVKTRLSWYESENFGILLTVVAVVITIVSLGTATAQVQALYATILAAVGNSVVAIILTSLVVIGIEVGLAKAFSIVSRELGGQESVWAALLLTVVATYATARGNTNASKYAFAANGLMDAGTQEISRELIQLDKELDLLKEEYESFQQADKELREQIGLDNNILDRIGLISVNNPYESAEEYYQRTASGATVPEMSVNLPEASLRLGLTLPDSIDNPLLNKET